MKMNKKVYLVWKYIDDSENFWPIGQKNLLALYESKESAIELIEKETENIKYDIMILLHCSYQDKFLKIDEPKYKSAGYIHSIEATYGNITVELYVEEKELLS